MTRLNFTGRRRIPQENISLRVRSTNTGPVLDVIAISLDQLNLPGDAVVVVEAYRPAGYNYMRFDAGTVSTPAFPSGQPLTEFESAETIRFRIKVVGIDADDGKILAAADRLQARTDEREEPHTSLLVILPAALGQVLWRVDLSDDEPKLVVNSEVGDWKGFATTPMFMAFVLPEALRQIIQWVLANIESVEEGDGSPLDLWVTFLTALGHDPRHADASDPADRTEWIEEAVNHFSREHRFLDQIADLIGVTET
jgi:hypothetical protein